MRQELASGRTRTEAEPERGETGEPRRTCSLCGATLDTDEWHPAATEARECRSVVVHVFCSDDCLTTWEE